MERPSPVSLLIAFVPFVAMCFTISLWDRIHPRVLGLPFNFFWLFAWLFVTPVFMWAANRYEERKHRSRSREGGIQ